VPSPLHLHAFAGLGVNRIVDVLRSAGRSAVTGTLSACDRLCSVVSEGEVLPFSIFDSMPMESPVSSDSSLTVIRCAWRKPRT
jgi:hypothetical protein